MDWCRAETSSRRRTPTRKSPDDPLKDSVAVSLPATNDIAVVTHPDVPFRTAAEMVAWAKQNPGKLTLATNGRT